MNSKNNHRASDDITPSSNPPPQTPDQTRNSLMAPHWRPGKGKKSETEDARRLPASQPPPGYAPSPLESRWRAAWPPITKTPTSSADRRYVIRRSAVAVRNVVITAAVPRGRTCRIARMSGIRRRYYKGWCDGPQCPNLLSPEGQVFHPFT